MSTAAAHHRIDLSFVGDVDRHRVRGASRAGDAGNDALRLGGGDVGDDHRGSLRSEAFGCDLADAAARAGDQGDLAFQSEHRRRTLSGQCDNDGILTSMASADPSPLVGVSMYRQVTSWWSWECDAAPVPGGTST